MWTRKAIKDYAKKFLKDHYLTAFMVTLVASILGASTQFFQITRKFDTNTADASRLEKLFPFIALGVLFAVAVVIARIIVSNTIRVGRARYFIKALEGDSRFDYLFSPFKNGEWSSTTLKMLVLDVTIFLWSLLLIVPGIIKYYQYYFVEYILADRPELSINDAKQVSTEMTSGQKADLFILDLSFLGWYLLGALAFGLGGFFVDPYQRATVATLYLLKARPAQDSTTLY